MVSRRPSWRFIHASSKMCALRELGEDKKHHIFRLLWVFGLGKMSASRSRWSLLPAIQAICSIDGLCDFRTRATNDNERCGKLKVVTGNSHTSRSLARGTLKSGGGLWKLPVDLKLPAHEHSRDSTLYLLCLRTSPSQQAWHLHSSRLSSSAFPQRYSPPLPPLWSPAR
jgi:hypothetical protein